MMFRIQVQAITSLLANRLSSSTGSSAAQKWCSIIALIALDLELRRLIVIWNMIGPIFRKTRRYFWYRYGASSRCPTLAVAMNSMCALCHAMHC